MCSGVQYKFNVNLVIKKNEKIPEQERVLGDTLSEEGGHVCARLWLNHGVHIIFKYGMDVLMISTLVGEGVRTWCTVGISLERRYWGFIVKYRME